MNFKFSISNYLILLSFIFTILAAIYPNLYVLGINNTYLSQGLFHIYFAQFFTGTFLHGGLFHLLANSVFIYIFGNMLEVIIGKNKMIVFFVFVTIFNGLFISILSEGNTVGISGFCMALIAYYTLELKSKNHPDYKGGFTAIILYVGIGFMPGISLLGHLGGAILGVIFYYLNREIMRKKMVGLIGEL